MPDSIAVSERYANTAYRLGSARSRSRLTGAEPLGPSQFVPGGVSPEAVIVKMAHAILSAGAIRQRREQENELAAREMEKSDLELTKLRREANQPQYDYTTPQGQRISGLSGPQAIAAEGTFTNPAPQSTPRGEPVTLPQDIGRFKAGEKVDPAALSAELATMRINAQRARDEKRQGSTKRYTAAVAGTNQLKAEEQQFAENVYAKDFAPHVSQTVAQLYGKDKKLAAAARKTLGLPPKWDPEDPADDSVLKDRLAGLKGLLTTRMLATRRKQHAARRKSYEQTIESEGAFLAAPEQPLDEAADPWENWQPPPPPTGR